MRVFDKKRYILAFIITIAIFFIGFFFGFMMDINRVNYFESTNTVDKLNLRSLQLQEELVKDSGFKDECTAFRFMFDKSIVELENNRERLETYNQQAKVKKEDFALLKREYTLSQINFWRVSKQLKASCTNSSDFVTVIYLYNDNAHCPDCESQGAVLTYYKMQLKQNILIFAINADMLENEPTVELIKNGYGITKYPGLIIEDKVYQEYQNKEQLKKILCEYYKTNETRSVICN